MLSQISSLCLEFRSPRFFLIVLLIDLISPSISFFWPNFCGLVIFWYVSKILNVSHLTQQFMGVINSHLKTEF